jgi:CubicO group peptidase (beta-lactamase class C family)
MSASTPNLRNLESARAVLAQAVDAGAFPGAAYGVLDRGGRTTGAVGGFTYDPESPRVTPETVYDLASVTKVAATTAAAMLLFERGLLDLDAPVGDLLPGFVIGMGRGTGRERVTVRMLLAHSSGLPGYAPLFREHRTASGLLRACLQLELTAPPGTREEYSDIGFILLGKLLEVVAGERLDRFCAREIFVPLGMSACFCPGLGERAKIPPTEREDGLGRRDIQGSVHDENCWVLGGIAGHAGLFASAGDLLRFAQAMLDGKLFSRSTIDLFTRRQQVAGGSRALGWDTPSGESSSGHYFGPWSVGHLGYTGTSLWVDLERELGVVLLTNRTWPTREN